MSLFGFPLVPLDTDFTSNYLVHFLKSFPLRRWEFVQLTERLKTTNSANNVPAVAEAIGGAMVPSCGNVLSMHVTNG